MSTRVMIADDQAMVRAGFAALLAAQDDFEVVGEAANGEEAVAMVEDRHPDVVLMDVRMPVMNGIEATRRIVEADQHVRVVMLTTFDIDEYVFEAIRAGASGFLLKDALPEELVAAVRVVAAGDALLAPSVTRRVIERFAAAPEPTRSARTEIAGLTDREREVLVQVARGRTNGEIAKALYIAEQTVKTHVSRVLGKLGVRDRAQAVVAAYESGLVVARPQD
ncbi:response regulator transcription factor [Naasia sp. SYSU D00948]|uniref:response regulator n=1 Tax=Naasia sp. SYSU D00948 TaxID=2817379 RepID=UPI001B30D016|nr:response regulator transcription factor [Naasia sp. SYSU D00948]